ncbi:hypothetical protein [Oryzomonas rubra]|nr:hypothetical protein [Oryzomonas rubra]
MESVYNPLLCSGEGQAGSFMNARTGHLGTKGYEIIISRKEPTV